MKATFFILVYFISLGSIFSQEVNCIEKQNELSTFVNQNKFKEAFEILAVLRKKCPSQSEDIYLLGIKVLQKNVDVASETSKEAAVRDLLKLYDQYDLNFPDNNNENLVNKAMTLYDNKTGDEKEIFAILYNAFTSKRIQFTNANALYIYFKLYHANFKNKKDGFSTDKLIEKYSEIATIIERNSIAFPKKSEEFSNANRACKSIVKEYLTAENLIPLAEKKFEANNNNTDWLLSTANLLSEKCASSTIFEKIATQLHQLKPSSKSAYHLGNYNLKNRNIKQAVNFFNQSATLATDKNEKANTYFTLATIIAASDKTEARKFILSAIENNPKNGSFYLFLANLYSNSVNECNSSPIVQKAIYYLANQTAKKAAEVELRLKTTANQLEKVYAKNSFTKSELDQIQKSGGKVSIGCWINETVQF